MKEQINKEQINKELKMCENGVITIEHMIQSLKDQRNMLLEKRIRLLNELEEMEDEE